MALVLGRGQVPAPNCSQCSKYRHDFARTASRSLTGIRRRKSRTTFLSAAFCLAAFASTSFSSNKPTLAGRTAAIPVLFFNVDRGMRFQNTVQKVS